jgi:hypothetical protein
MGADRPRQVPLVHKAATHLREHDDRDQFLAGVDLILAGIETIDREGEGA